MCYYLVLIVYIGIKENILNRGGMKCLNFLNETGLSIPHCSIFNVNISEMSLTPELQSVLYCINKYLADQELLNFWPMENVSEPLCVSGK